MSTTLPDVDVEEVVEEKNKIVPPYNVIVLNDDYHTFEFVIAVLMKCVPCKLEQAKEFTKTAHQQGRAIIWTGSLEVAEFKRDQILTFRESHPDLGNIGALGVEIEPAS